MPARRSIGRVSMAICAAYASKSAPLDVGSRPGSRIAAAVSSWAGSRSCRNLSFDSLAFDDG